ncbi:MAG: HAMP domain-containing protein [Firmicutes bacterium]|nr:HAMP domain-containing protein [Bacillota bacterium]
MRPNEPSQRRAYLQRFHLSSRMGLQRRALLYVILGSAVGLLFFSLIAQRALAESSKIIFRERLHLARLIAREVSPWVHTGGDDGDLQVTSRSELERILERFLTYQDDEASYQITLLDRDLEALFVTASISSHEHLEHMVLLKTSLAGKEGVMMHQPDEPARPPHVVAYATLPGGLPGGVMLEQYRDEVMSIPRSLVLQMGVLGAIFIGAGAGLAWLATRRVAAPLVELTSITRRIASGDLSGQVPLRGMDEVWELSASLEEMRRQLEENHALLAQANQELERRVEERTRELERRNAELAATSQRLRQREAERTFLLKKTIQAQEEERQRIARGLHDTVGQCLSTLIVSLSTLETHASTPIDSQACAIPDLTSELAGLRALISRTVADVRRLIVDLRPELLDELGLSSAVDWHVRNVLERKGIHVTVDVDSLAERLPREVELVVFRVVQEAVTNILKHAHAGKVVVSLRWDGPDLVGVVEDDGIGLLGEEAKSSGGAGGFPSDKGVGIIGMRERISLLGGKLQIQSEPGKGARLLFRVPSVKKEMETP